MLERMLTNLGENELNLAHKASFHLTTFKFNKINLKLTLNKYVYLSGSSV